MTLLACDQVLSTVDCVQNPFNFRVLEFPGIVTVTNMAMHFYFSYHSAKHQNAVCIKGKQFPWKLLVENLFFYCLALHCLKG